MARQNFLFVIFCSILSTGLIFAYFVLSNHFSPYRKMSRDIERLENEVRQRNLQITRLENQIFDFQQEVALALPALEKIRKNPTSLPLRSLASVAQKPVSHLDFSSALMERGRTEFRQANFRNASQKFSEVIQKFPTSPHVVQAHFLLAESLYLAGKQQECLDVIDQMMTLFPEHDLTGFIMLRMGQIFQERSRVEEASEVYKVVQKNFSFNSELRAQAVSLAQTIR